MDYRQQIIKDEIKGALSIKQVIQDATGLTFNSANKIRCPFHNDSDASLSIKKGYFKCFGCGEGGDIFGFTMRYYGLSFKDAIEYLDSKYCLNIIGKPVTIAQQVKARKIKQARDAMERRKVKRIELDNELCTELRICNEALRKGVLEPYSDIWCYYIDKREDVSIRLWLLEQEEKEDILTLEV